MKTLFLLAFLLGLLYGVFTWLRRVRRAIKFDLHGDCDQWGNVG